MDALFLAELNERLFVHFIQGAWRVPSGARLLPVLPFDRGRMGRIACADRLEVARACAGLGQGRVAPPAALAAAYEAQRAVLADLRALEGFDDPAAPPPVLDLPGEGPLVLLSAAQTPVALLAGVLIAGARRGVLWKPAPRAAASAHLMMGDLGPLAGGNLALLQGDHATGALLRGRGALIWASPDANPEAALSLPATAPHRP